MNVQILADAAKWMGRPDLLVPLAAGWVATELMSYMISMKRPSSIGKKAGSGLPGFPRAYTLKGSRRKFYKLEEVEAWAKVALMEEEAFEVVVKPPKAGCPNVRLGRPRSAEKVAASRLGISVPELRARQRQKQANVG